MKKDDLKLTNKIEPNGTESNKKEKINNMDTKPVAEVQIKMNKNFKKNQLK